MSMEKNRVNMFVYTNLITVHFTVLEIANLQMSLQWKT